MLQGDSRQGASLRPSLVRGTATTVGFVVSADTGHSSTYERALLEQGRYQAGRLRGYITKLAGYLTKGEGGAEFLRAHTGERVS